MKLDTRLICLLLALSLPGVTLFAEEHADAQPQTTFAEFVSSVDLSKNTSLYITEFWRRHKGKTVTWTGKVHGVQGGRSGAKITVANSASPLYNGFNIVLVTRDKASAAKLKVDQEISFSGQLHNYKNHRGNPVIVYLGNGRIITE